MTPRWNRYVALGDSISESLGDPVAGSGEPCLAWADRLAMILDGNARLRGVPFACANLAARGRQIEHVVSEQVPRAIDLRADLVSILAGGNDLMDPSADPDALAARLEVGVAAARASGADVLLATCFDPRFAIFLGSQRGRAATYNANLWSIARTHGTFIIDLWGMRELQSRSLWAEDRIHLAPAGHRLLASRAAHSLGIPYYELAAPGPVPPADLVAVVGRR